MWTYFRANTEAPLRPQGKKKTESIIPTKKLVPIMFCGFNDPTSRWIQIVNKQCVKTSRWNFGFIFFTSNKMFYLQWQPIPTSSIEPMSVAGTLCCWSTHWAKVLVYAALSFNVGPPDLQKDCCKTITGGCRLRDWDCNKIYPNNLYIYIYIIYIIYIYIEESLIWPITESHDILGK